MPSQTITSNGTFDVPDGVSSLTVDLFGEAGQDATDGGGTTYQGGLPGHVSGTLSVAPLETLTLRFEGAGNGGVSGFSGADNGGQGGDAADIRQGGTSLSDRVAVAAGGGGAAPGGDGGAGGADQGEDGQDSVFGGGLGGGGATQSAGNALGQGGDGLDGDTQGGGGGGGGYYGGFGGGDSDNGDGAGGGGGGSNYDDDLTTVSANLRGDSSGTRREITLQYSEPAPTSLSATPTAENEVTVSWSNPFVDQDGFNVYRSDSFGGSTTADYTQVASVSAASTSYVDTNVEDGEKYYYRVTATDSDGFGESVVSNEDTAVTPFPAPQNVTAEMSVAGSQISLSWTVVDDSPDGKINVYRSTDGSLGSSVASLGDDATSYLDTNVSTGTTYHYTIRRATPDATADSEQVSRDPGENAPQNLSADSAGPFAVSLSWTDVTSDETEFDVLRREVFDDGSKTTFQTVANALPPGSEAHTDDTVSPSRTYEYQVRVSDT